MSKRNNIEDFFNNSLEGFNEQPSEQVWSGIEMMLDVKMPFWKTWKFWGWFSGAFCLVVCLVVYQAMMNQKMTTLLTQNTILLEQNKILTEKIGQTQIELKQVKEEEKEIGEILNDVKVVTVDKTKINSTTSKGIIAKEQPYFASTLTENKSAFSIIEWIEKSRKAGFFDKPNERRKEELLVDRTLMDLDDRLQESVFDEQNKGHRNLMSNSSESGVKLTDSSFSGTLPFERLNGSVQYEHPLLISDRHHQANLTLIKGMYIRPTGMKFIKPSFTPSLRLGLTGGAFTSFSNIPNSINGGYNSGVMLEWLPFKNFGFIGGVRYNQLTYETTLDVDNQDILQRYPQTEQINQPVESIIANHYYLGIPVGIMWKIPLESLKGKFYIHSGFAWQLYLPQNFEYVTVDNLSIISQNNRLYAYFGSTTLSLGYEKKIRDNLRLQIGTWVEKSLVKYGVEDRSSTNLGLSATLIFGK